MHPRRRLLKRIGAGLGLVGSSVLLSKITPPIYAQSTPIEIEPGSFVSPADYIVFKENGEYYARNGKTGVIEFGPSDDATTIIQSVLDALTPGRTWKETVLLKGVFECRYISGDACITIPSYTRLILNGVLKLADGQDKRLITTETGGAYIDLLGGVFDGNKDNQTPGTEQSLVRIYSSSYVTVQGIIVRNAIWKGLHIVGREYESDCYNINVSNVIAHNNGSAGVDVTGENAHDINLNNIVSYNNPAGSGITIGDGYKININNAILWKNAKGIVVDRGYDININNVVMSEHNTTGIRLTDAGTGEYPYRIKLSNCYSYMDGLNGFDTLAAKDCSFMNCVAYKPAEDGFNLDADTERIKLVNCKAIECGGDGFDISGSKISLLNCSAYKNQQTGFRITGRYIDVISCFGINNNQVGGLNHGLVLNDAMYCKVIACLFADYQTTPTQKYGIIEKNAADYNIIMFNRCEGNVTKDYEIIGANTIVRYNQGYRTENHGMVTLTGDGSTKEFVAKVEHGLVSDKVAVSVSCTKPTTAPPSYIYGYLSDENNDDFKETIVITVKFDTAPASGEQFDIYWRAEVIQSS